MQSVIKTNWDLTQFLTRPISAALLVLTVFLLLYPVLRHLLRRRSAVDASG
jgi:TctA family transporter